MKLLVAYRAYSKLMEAPCHEYLYPALGEFYVTKATYCIIKKLNHKALPHFVSVIPDSMLRCNLSELEYLDSMPKEYVRVYLTDDEKTNIDGIAQKTVWECFDQLLQIYNIAGSNRSCRRKTLHTTCLNNLVRSLAKNTRESCASLNDIRTKLRIH
ncbi:MAG: hypothetical protein LBV04_03865 [Deferribacteraceae bacterium]|jgi:hypothetical protein|nr:hypothetical protein [Deferribacteraceae bacterium]